MSAPKPEPKIEMQDAQVLAQGYLGWWRTTEILSILSFWAITGTILYRAWGAIAARPWVAGLAFFAGYVLADLASGLVHWGFDTWGDTRTPIFGQTVIRPFREHHVDEKAMTRHDWIETNGANCLVALPVAAITLFIPLGVAGWEATGLFLQVSMTSMILWVMLTNQFHKWSHEDEVPAVLAALMKARIILEPGHHQRHHTAPFDTYYCITHGWLNPLLHQLNFFRHLETLVTAVTGAVPRRDDIGLDAALAIAPLKPVEPSSRPQVDLPRP